MTLNTQKKLYNRLRREGGHSLKSSISHILMRDTRNDPFLASSGSYVRIKNELAGIGGNVQFLKNDFEHGWSRLLTSQIILSGSFKTGLLVPLNFFHSSPSPGAKKSSYISDRYFLGGPNCIRGFEHKGIGNRVEGKKYLQYFSEKGLINFYVVVEDDALGGDMFWAGGMSIFFPLLFKKGWENLKGHLFINGGSIVPLSAQGKDFFFRFFIKS